MFSNVYHLAISGLKASLAAVYGLSLKMRGWVWRQGWLTARSLPGRVISVGNIEAGGTGKSPVVISLCRYLVDQGYYPAVLTRGYGAQLGRSDTLVLLGGTTLVRSRQGLANPDEAMMQSLALPTVPIVVGANRFLAAQRFLALSRGEGGGVGFDHLRNGQPTHWVLDDGFQHWAINRQLDLVLLYGAKEGEGDDHVAGSRDSSRRRQAGHLLQGALLPSGRLREPVTALSRASVILVMRASHVDSSTRAELSRLTAPREVPVFSVMVLTRPLGESVAQASSHSIKFSAEEHGRALLVSGIARPQVFTDDFKGQSHLHQVVDSLVVGDHQRIPKDLLFSKASRAQVKSVVTTAKDWARDPGVFRQLSQTLKLPVFVMELEVAASNDLWKEILKTV